MMVKVKYSVKWSDNVHFISLESDGLQFEPGNFVDIYTPSGNKKPYSIASTPNSSILRFYVKVFPSQNGVSNYISTLKSGDMVKIGNPTGFFTPGKNEQHKKYVYIATGTGMAPFMSALEYYEHKPYSILYGVRSVSDSICDIRYSRLNLAVSREDTPYPKRISNYYPKLPVNQPNDFTYYICGQDAMIAEACAYLTDNGVPWHKIKTEQFFYSA